MQHHWTQSCGARYFDILLQYPDTVLPDEDRTTKLHHNANIAEMWYMWHLANNVANNHSNLKTTVQYDPEAIPTSVAVTMDTFHLIEQTLRYVTGCVTYVVLNMAPN